MDVQTLVDQLDFYRYWMQFIGLLGAMVDWNGWRKRENQGNLFSREIFSCKANWYGKAICSSFYTTLAGN